MDQTDYRKLKVAELRQILQSRGVESKGLRKDELIQKCLETGDEESSSGSPPPEKSTNESNDVECSQDTKQDGEKPTDSVSENIQPEVEGQSVDTQSLNATSVKSEAKDLVVEDSSEMHSSEQPAETSMPTNEGATNTEQSASTDKQAEEPTNIAAVDADPPTAVVKSESVCSDVANMKTEPVTTVEEEQTGEEPPHQLGPEQIDEEIGGPVVKKPKKEWKYDPQIIVMEGTEWVDSEKLQLDKYHSDLNLVIKRDGLSCTPLSKAGFGYMWAGARANYGVSLPCSVVYQVKFTHAEHTNIKNEPFGANYMARVGWSIASTDYQLGESPYSFGYQSNGKCCCDNQFVDYDAEYTVGDVISCYLEITDELVTMSFAKNLEPPKQAYQFVSHLLGLNSLFPHISTKNMAMHVNFGYIKKVWYPVEMPYIWIGNLPEDQRERAIKPPMLKSECEVLLMVGLIGAGKTHWVKQKVEGDMAAKQWNILSTAELLKKMKVDGVEAAQCYNGRWDDLFDKTNTCLKKLLPIAASKRRNYIIDQTNVYEGAQSRKVRPFKGFNRKAVIVVPADDVYQQRLEERSKTSAKSVHQDAVLEMKANFHIPVAGARKGLEHSFDEVIFTELDAEEAQSLVKQYNTEGKQKFKPISKQYHKREQKAKQRAEDLARKAERSNLQGRGGGRGGHFGRGGLFSNTGTKRPAWLTGYLAESGSSFGMSDQDMAVQLAIQGIEAGTSNQMDAQMPNQGIRMHNRNMNMQGNTRMRMPSGNMMGMQMGNQMRMPAGNRMGTQMNMPIGNQMGMQTGNQMGMQAGNQMGMQSGNQMGMQTGNRMGMQTGIQMGMQSGNQMGMQTGNQMGMQAGNQMGMQAGNQMGLHAGNQMGVQTGNQMGMRTGNQMGMQAGNQMGMQTGNQMGMQTGNQMGRQAGNQTGMQTGNQAGMQTGSQMGMQTGNQMGRQAGNRMGMQTGSQVGMQTGNKTGMQAGNQLGMQSGNQMGRQAGNQMSMQTGNQMGMQTGNQAGMQTGNQMRMQTGNQMGVQVGNQMGMQAGNQMGMPTGNQIGMQTGNQMGMQTGNQMGMQTGNQMGMQTRNQMGMQTGNQVGMQTGNQIDIQSVNQLNRLQGNQASMQAGNQQAMRDGNQMNMSREGQMDLQTGNQMDEQDVNQMNMQTGVRINTQAGQQTNSQTGNQINMLAGNQMNMQTGNQMSAQAGNQMNLQVGNQMNPQAGNQMNMQAGNQMSMQMGHQAEMQTANQMGMQSDNQRNMLAGNQMGMQADNRFGMSSAEHMGTQGGSQMGSQTENQMGMQMGNQMSTHDGSQMDMQLDTMGPQEVAKSVLAKDQRQKQSNETQNTMANSLPEPLRNSFIQTFQEQMMAMVGSGAQADNNWQQDPNAMGQGAWGQGVSDQQGMNDSYTNQQMQMGYQQGYNNYG